MIESEVQAPDPLDEEVAVISHFFAEACYNHGYGCAQFVFRRLVYVVNIQFDGSNGPLIDLFERTNEVIVTIEKSRLIKEA